MRFTLGWLIFFSTFPLMLFCSGKVQAVESSMDVRYWDWGNTPLRDNYQFELLHLVLDKTRPVYGDYTLTRVSTFLTPARVRRELSRGKIFNVQAAPWRPLTIKNSEPAIRIDIDMTKGLMGYRQLVINSSDQPLFSTINQLNQLKEYVVGVGKGWVDAEIFNDNGFRVNSAANFETLLPMLASRRFDFISLSVIEAEQAINNSGFKGSMSIADGPLLYMPLPFVFYVSIHEPELAKRIHDGLKLSMADGSFDLLFDNHFSPYIQYIREHRNQFLILQNRHLPETMRNKPEFLDEN